MPERQKKAEEGEKKAEECEKKEEGKNDEQLTEAEMKRYHELYEEMGKINYETEDYQDKMLRLNLELQFMLHRIPHTIKDINVL